MAVADEMLEAQPAPWSIQLVGPARLACGLASAVGLEAAQDQRAELHLAAIYVRLSLTGRGDGQDGQDLYGQTVEDENAQRIAGDDPTEPVAVPARRLRRFAGWVEASQAAACIKSGGDFG